MGFLLIVEKGDFLCFLPSRSILSWNAGSRFGVERNLSSQPLNYRQGGALMVPGRCTYCTLNWGDGGGESSYNE